MRGLRGEHWPALRVIGASRARARVDRRRALLDRRGAALLAAATALVASCTLGGPTGPAGPYASSRAAGDTFSARGLQAAAGPAGPAGPTVAALAVPAPAEVFSGVELAAPAEPAVDGEATPARAPWQPPDVPRRRYTANVERWRPLVRALLAEAWDEGRLDGAAGALDDDFILAVIQQESAGDPEAESWAGALGLVQVMPATFAEMMAGSRDLADQIDPAAMVDAASNLRAGIRYLALAMEADEGNLYWSLAAYNAGIEAVAAWRAVGLYAVPPVGGYVETAYYARVIVRNYLRHRPGLEMYVPPIMPPEHVPGAIRLLREAGLW